MAKGKLELKIVKDSNGKKIELENMSLGAAKSLNTFLESLINMIDSMPQKDKEGIRIQIVKGSACVVAEGPEAKINVLETGFEDVANNTSTNKEFVNNWKFIQSVILANGLGYEVNFYDSHNTKKPVIEKIKANRVFRVKAKKRNKSDTNVVFLKGKLMEIGGFKPNFHLFQNNELSVIHCDEVGAQSINRFLYKEIYISTWCKKIPGSKPHYTFCDNYTDEQDLKKFKTLFDLNLKASESEEFVNIHDYFKSYVANNDLGRFKKIMRIYNHQSTSIGTLKALLVITKSFKNHETISGMRNSIKELLESKIGRKLI